MEIVKINRETFFGISMKEDDYPFRNIPQSEKSKENHISILKEIFYIYKAPLSLDSFPWPRETSTETKTVFNQRYNKTEYEYVEFITDNFTKFGNFRIDGSVDSTNYIDFLTYLSIHPFFVGYSDFNTRIKGLSYTSKKMGSFTYKKITRPYYENVDWDRLQYLLWISYISKVDNFESKIISENFFPREDEIPFCYYGDEKVHNLIKGYINMFL